MSMTLKLRTIMELLRENAAKIIATLGLLSIFVIGYVAAQEIAKHDGSSVAHSPSFEIIAKSIRKNRTDIDIQAERMANNQKTTDDNFARMEARAIRTEGKIDRILEKL